MGLLRETVAVSDVAGYQSLPRRSKTSRPTSQPSTPPTNTSEGKCFSAVILGTLAADASEYTAS